MRKVLYVFGVLDDSDIDWIGRVGVHRPFGVGDILIRQGVPIESILLILNGNISVTVAGVGELALLGSGELLGEMSLVDSAPPSATVTAISDGLALYISKETLSQRLAADMAFGCRFYRALSIVLADRLRNTEHRMAYDEAQTLDDSAVLRDEIDIGILDTLSIAGDRFDRLAKMVVGRGSSAGGK